MLLWDHSKVFIMIRLKVFFIYFGKRQNSVIAFKDYL